MTIREKQSVSMLTPRTVKNIARLRQRKYRDAEGLLLAEGVRLLEESVRSDWEIPWCLYTAAAAARPRVQQLLTALATRGSNVALVPENLLPRLCDTSTPPGVLAVVKRKDYSLAACTGQGAPSLWVVLDGVQDPGNAGTIVRTAYAAGCSGVFLTRGSVDIFAPKTVRATMGAVFHLPIVPGLEPSALLAWLREQETQCIVTAAGAPRCYFAADLTRPLALVLGNESQGVSEILRAAADEIVRIPMRRESESLNVATAAAVILFEAVRQRWRGAPCNLPGPML